MNDSSKEVEVRDEEGRLTGRFQLAEGRLHGRSTLYSAGRVIAEIAYAGGQRHGEMRSYGEQGQLSSVVPHARGLPHGEASYFYPDGGLARRAHFKEGRLHGEVCDFGPDGKLLASDTYVEGKKEVAGAAPTAATGPKTEGAQRKSWLSRLVEG